MPTPMSGQAPPSGVAAPGASRRPLIAACIAFLLAGAAAVAVVRLSEQQRLHEQRTNLANLTGKHGDAIQRSTQHALSTTSALAALVRQGQGSIAHFDAIASELLRYYPSAGALQLAPDGIIQQVVPLVGNEIVLGLNLLQDPARNQGAFIARDTGKLTLAGPFELKEGGLGALGYLPVFLNDSQGKPAFWGFTLVLIRYPQALQEVQLAQLAQQGLGYELWRIHPDSGKKQSIAASSATALIDPMTQTLSMPNGNWMLSVAPLKGWGEPLGLALKSALGLLFSLLLGYLVKLLLESRAHKRHLETLVQQRTAALTSEREALRDSENRFRMMFEGTADALLLLDPRSGQFIDCNQATVVMLRCTDKQEVLLLHPSQLSPLHQMDGRHSAEKADEMIATALRLGSQRFEWIHCSDHREDFPVEVLLTPIQLGERQLIITTWRDITERKQAEIEIQRVSNLLRGSIDALDEAFVLFDPQDRLVLCNDSYREIYSGIAHLMVPGVPFEDLLRADAETGRFVAAIGRVDEWVAERLASHRAANTTLIQKHSNGRTLRIVERKLPDGHIVGFRIDISEVMRAQDDILRLNAGLEERVDQLHSQQEELRQSTVQLRDSEATLSASINTALDAVVQMDAAGIITRWNTHAEEIFGWKREEAIGRMLHETIIPQQHREAHVRGMKHFLATGEGSVLNKRIEITALRRDGREFPIELSITTLKVADKVEFSAFLRDISERKRAEQTLRESTEKLRLAADAADLYDWEWDVPSDTLTWGHDPVRLLGQPDERTRKYPDFRDLVHPEDRERYLAVGRNTMKTGETYAIEFRIVKRDGAVRWLAVRGKCVFDSAGAPARMLGVSQDITERKQTQEEIQKLAFTDTLTGLPNRRLLIDRLKQALATSARNPREGALLFIDLDNFKTVNDTLGHDVGDLLLQQVTQRLLACVREGDTVARLGGDEFVVLLQDLNENAPQAAIQVGTVGNKILSALSQVYLLAGHVHHCSASIGVALFGPQSESVDELLKRADLAMYSAKTTGRNTLRFFDPQMQTMITTRTALEADLREAVR